MNASVTIQVGELANVLFIPLPALERKGDQHYVFLASDDGAIAAPVEVGESNLTHVEIVHGLSEGDEIHLVRPPGAVLPDTDEGEATTSGPDDTGPDDSAPDDSNPGGSDSSESSSGSSTSGEKGAGAATDDRAPAAIVPSKGD